MEKLINQNDNPLVIPYGKAVSVGNFKLWRSNYVVGSGKEKAMLECMNLSTIDGAWMVRIPAACGMFSTICNGYATTDETIRDNFLGMIFANVYNVSTMASEALHDAFFFLTEMMTYPYLLLSEDDMVARMKKGLLKSGMEEKKAQAHIDEMVKYRRDLYALIAKKKDVFIADYEKQQEERRKREPEELKRMEQDAIAEDAIDTINGKGED